MNKRRPELLIPASSLEVLKTAVIFGADAVYIGGGRRRTSRRKICGPELSSPMSTEQEFM